MAALSGWLLPRGHDASKLNRDAYVQPGPLERAQTWQILIRHRRRHRRAGRSRSNGSPSPAFAPTGSAMMSDDIEYRDRDQRRGAPRRNG